jgi:transcriptional regulator of arginine metabolism
MSKDHEMQRRRQLVIRDILREDEEPVVDQADLVERLGKLGIRATQPSVSRDLKELGAVRSGGRYHIPSWAERADESPFRRVLPLIRSVRTAGPYQILMLTMEGAGAAVAAAIDASDWEDLIGTVSGHSSVLLLTEHKFFQDLLVDRLKFFRDEYGPGGGEVQRATAE